MPALPPAVRSRLFRVNAASSGTMRWAKAKGVPDCVSPNALTALAPVPKKYDWYESAVSPGGRKVLVKVPPAGTLPDPPVDDEEKRPPPWISTSQRPALVVFFLPAGAGGIA